MEVIALSEAMSDPDKFDPEKELDLGVPPGTVLRRWLGLPVPEETDEEEEGDALES